MEKYFNLLVEFPIAGFLVLMSLISAISFVMMVNVPGAQSPESMPGLPIWLIAIWSPNIAVIIVWLANKEFTSKIQSAFSLPGLSLWLLLILVPLFIAGCLLFMEALKGTKIEWSNFRYSYLLPLILINLIMGPLGEELGWRAFLYPALKDNYGWMASALIVGVIWALWHAPLWFIDSPQSKIPFLVFGGNVICLSILMAMVYNHSNGSLIPIIIFHLLFNVSSGVIDIIGTHESGDYFTKSLYFYVPLVFLCSGIHEWANQNQCSIN